MFRTAAGAELAYDVEGPEGGVPVVFVHGLTGARTTWRPILDDLAADHRTFAVDQRGHGGSSRTKPYDVEGYATDLASFLDEVVGEPAVLVGHSLGGVVSAEVAMRRPDLVARALLEDPPMFLAGGGGPEFEASPFGFVFPLMLGDLRDKQARAAGIDEYVFGAASMPALNGRGTMADVLGPEGVQREAEAKRDFDPDALEAAIDGALGAHDPTAPITVPVLVLRAEAFAAFREHDVEPFLRANPHGTVELVEGTSHLVHDEEPAAFVTRLRAFLSG